MSPKLPRAKPRKVIRALKALGFTLERQSGSHMIFVHADGRVIPLPYHSDKDLKPGLLRRIIRDAGVTVDEFRERMQ